VKKVWPIFYAGAQTNTLSVYYTKGVANNKQTKLMKSALALGTRIFFERSHIAPIAQYRCV